MHRWIRTLTVLLIVQLSLAGYLQFSGDRLGQYRSDTPLLSIDFTTLNRVTIEGPDKAAVTLQRVDGAWVLPDLSNFPVSERKVTEFFDELKSFVRGWPVGTTKLAAKQFELTDDEFERRIHFQRDDQKVATLYLGSSPGYKQVYARTADRDESYAIAFSTYEAGVSAADWQNRDFAKRDRNALTRVALNDIELVNQDGKLELQSVPEDKQANQEKVNKLLSKVTTLNFLEVLGTEAKPEYGFETPAVTLTMAGKDDKEEIFQIGLPTDASMDFAVLKISSSPYYLKISKVLAEQFGKAALNDLLEDKPAPQADSPDSAAGAAEPAASEDAGNVADEDQGVE